MICYLFEAPKYFFFAPDLPELLYYSHFPAMIGALLVGLFVYLNGPRQLLNKLLFLITACFSLWVLGNLVAWTNIHSDIIGFVWPLLDVMSALMLVFGIYFVYVFLKKTDVSFGHKFIFFLLLLPVLLLGFTDAKIRGFDLVECDAFRFISPSLHFYGTALGYVAIIWISVMLIRHYRIAAPESKKQIILIGAGIELFFLLFHSLDFIGAYLNERGILSDSRMEFFGILSMLVFLTFISILIVRFKAFNIRVLAPTALVVALVFLVGTQFTYVTTTTGIVLTSITFALVCLVGILLVKSVRKEVEAREKIEKLARELKVANDHLEELNRQKSEFVSFASHQLRSPLTSILGNASMLLEGDFGELKGQMKDVVDTIFKSVKTQISVVEDYLNVSRIELGTMKYNLADMDFKDLVREVVSEQKPNIEAKGLTQSLSMDDSKTYKIKADPDKFKQVLMNIVDNSIKYTPQGSISISLDKDAAKGVVRFKVQDTGVGIDPAVMPKLFQKFSRASNAHEANIHGTGLGLFLAKDIVAAHGGKVWAESDGVGKGSRFIVEMPEVK